MVKKKIFFFEKINYSNFFFVLILKIFFFRVSYRTLSAGFQNEKIINLLSFINVCWLRYDKKEMSANYSNNINKTSEKYGIFIKKITTFAIYKKIINLLNVKNNNLNNFNYLIGNFFFRDLIFGPVSNIILLEKKYSINKFIIFYFPSTLENYAAIKISKEKVCLIGFHLFFIELIKFFLISIKSFTKKNFYNKSKAKILFVPHNGLKYGNVYKKNFIFKKYKKKSFSNSDILVMDNNLNSRDKKYYELIDANYTSYPNIKKINLYIYVQLYNFIKKDNFLLNYLLIKLTNVILNYKLFLNKNNTIKAAFFFYDINADLNLVFSCNLLNIETISIQERTVGYHWTPFMFFDHYFISGKKYSKLINKNKFSYKNTYVSGLVRSALLKKNELTLNKVLVFDVPNISFYDSKIWGDFSSMRKRIYLYNGILRLAAYNPNIKFIIRPKLAENFNDILIPAVEKKIKKNNLKNVTFTYNLKNSNTYTIANECDVVIGSYSSIFDELFSIRRKILIYDKNFLNFSHPLKNSKIHCKNFAELNMQFNSLVKNNNKKKGGVDKYLNTVRNNFFYFGKKTNYNFIINKINQIIK
jgi:hypothetical protein